MVQKEVDMLGTNTRSYLTKLSRNDKKEIEERVKLLYLTEYYGRRTCFSAQ
jgi:hypothetical protein